MSLPTEQLINELQSYGVRLADPKAGVESRRGGAGPSDHKALTIDGVTIMAPVHTAPAFDSPYVVEKPGPPARAGSCAMADAVAEVRFPQRPQFYDLKTAGRRPVFSYRDAARPRRACDHGPADLHPLPEPHENLPILRHRPVACGGHGPSSARRPAQLAEVARAAVELDGVKHMVMTTGTPHGRDRGAAILCESAAAVKAAVDLPIQAQCEPPDEDGWFERLHAPASTVSACISRS